MNEQDTDISCCLYYTYYTLYYTTLYTTLPYYSTILHFILHYHTKLGLLFYSFALLLKYNSNTTLFTVILVYYIYQIVLDWLFYKNNWFKREALKVILNGQTLCFSGTLFPTIFVVFCSFAKKIIILMYVKQGFCIMYG